MARKNQSRRSRLEAPRIGIDIGRVVMCPTDAVEGPDTSFLSASPELAMRIPPASGAEEVIRELVALTGGNVWFVSKAGQRVAGLTRAWFRHNDFFERTGVPSGHLRFCLKRHEKRGIAKQLLLSHFIDDRVDVLEPMRDVVSHLYLFGVQKRPAPTWTTPVLDWNGVAQSLLPALSPRQSAEPGCELAAPSL